METIVKHHALIVLQVVFVLLMVTVKTILVIARMFHIQETIVHYIARINIQKEIVKHVIEIIHVLNVLMKNILDLIVNIHVKIALLIVI